ncbi:MAG: ABC transporter ATP-binding protein/permease [Spirochaetaceae bacterium]|jgi:ABC-type multidrug transport system fused ATPase/permease subunit|nr:ABC transporter ATP-binding protein/permease [Spirochaetaceae bacterium]
MKQNYLGAYGRLLRYVGAIKAEAAVKAAISLGVNASYVFQAVVMARAVSLVFNGARVSAITPLVVTALAAVLARGALTRALEVWTKIMAARVKTKIRLLVFDKILRLGPSFVYNKRSGQLQSLVLDGIESLEPFLVNYIPHIVSVALTGLAIGIYLCNLDWLTGAVVISAMLLCVTVPYFTVPLVAKSIVHYWTSYARLNAQYVDALQGMTTLKAFNAGKIKGAELAADALDFYQKQIRNTTFSLIDSGLMNILMSVASLVTAALAAYRTELGIIPVAAVSVFLFLSIECARPMADLNMYWHTSFLGLSVATGIFEIIDMEINIKEKDVPDAESLDGDAPDISLQNVSFAYRKETGDALHNVSFDIPAGKTIAVTGRSGSGKSTLVNLLLRFYDTDSGAVLINGVNIRDYSLSYLQSKIAVVFQETYLFGTTVFDNIRMARPGATEEEVINAAKAANAHEFIAALPNGYDTILSERGAALSGGERQRISIARAVLKDAPILLLDEATSSVDTRNETLIQDALKALTKNRTTLIIAHRLSTIQHADTIFVLEKGSIAERGAHDELLAKNGVYAALMKAQTEEAV